MWATVFLWLIWGVHASSIPEFVYPEITSGDTSIIYTILDFPLLGSLRVNDTTDVLIASSFNSTDLLSYHANHPYNFSYITGNCSSATAYDSFQVNIVTYPSLENITDNVYICLQDIQDIPEANDMRVLVLNPSFKVNITDWDDQVGVYDHELSIYSFHDESGEIATGSKVIFNSVNLGIAVLTDCDGNDLEAGVEYEQEVFCVEDTDQTGTVEISYRAIDRFGGESNDGTITFSTRDISVCVEKNDTCSLRVANDTTGYFQLPSLLQAKVSLVYEVLIEFLPLKGKVYANGTEVNIGDRLPFDVNLSYVPDEGYFNRYYFPEFSGGYYTYDVSPYTTCTDSTGCLDSIRYRGINSTTNFSVTSVLGEFYFIVEKTVVEELTVCIPHPFSPWGENGICRAYGERQTAIPIYLSGTDGRGDYPAYKTQILSLPLNGTLYHNLQDGNTIIFGPEVEIGDEITASFGYVPPLLYVSNGSYYNHLRYEISPEDYITLQDENGTYVSGCDDECNDFFAHRIISDLNDTLASESAVFQITVTRTVYDQLTVCAADGYSIWDYPCYSFGYEGNTLHGEYATPVYLTVNNTHGEDFTYVFTSVPAHGKLYYNTGNETDLELGALVKVNDTFIPETQPELIYVGDYDYFNDVIYTEDELLLFTDKRNTPIGDCINAILDGCPDSFNFYANTSSGRRSNPGVYRIFVHSTISNASITGPDAILFTPDRIFNFTGIYSINYITTDMDIYMDMVQINIFYGVVGMTGSMENLTLPSYSTCFNTTGCEDIVEFIAYPSDIQYVLSRLFIFYNESLLELDSDPIAISIIRREPDGITTFNAFRIVSTDTVTGIDIEYFSQADTTGDEYYNDEFLEDYWEEELESITYESWLMITIISNAVLGALWLIVVGFCIYRTWCKTPSSTRLTPRKVTRVQPSYANREQSKNMRRRVRFAPDDTL